MSIILIRHAQTDFDDLGKRHGSTDLPLNRKGKKAAQELKDELSGQTFDAVFSSPLTHAVETAHIIFPDKNIVKNDLLRGFNFGELEGVRFTEPLEHFPQNSIEEYNGRQFLLPNEGESLEHVVHRVQRFIDLLQFSFGFDKRVAVVTHPLVIDIFRALAEARPWHTYLGEARLFEGVIEVTINP